MTGDNPVNDDLARLYRDAIRNHATEPTGYRNKIEATHRHEEYNPLCGDRIEVQLRVAAGAIEAAAFDGEACAICLASASLLCGLAPGRTVLEVRQLGEDLRRALDTSVGAASAAIGMDENPGRESRLKPLPQVPAQDLDDGQYQSRLKPLPHVLAEPAQPPGLPEELMPLLGVRPFPSRVRCATLPWSAAARALSD
jgi:nitrogen fixation NifU-like protein